MSRPPPEPPARTSATAGPPDTATGRPLSRRERDVVAFMIDHGASFDADEAVEDEDRARWRAQLTTARAGRACGCGSCPSVELLDVAEAGPATGTRVVLEAATHGAMVLLFVDDDRLSYLELAPTDDRTFPELPDPTDLHTA